MESHTCNPAFGMLRQEKDCEFQAHPISGNNNKVKQKNFGGGGKMTRVLSKRPLHEQATSWPCKKGFMSRQRLCSTPKQTKNSSNVEVPHPYVTVAVTRVQYGSWGLARLCPQKR